MSCLLYIRSGFWTNLLLLGMSDLFLLFPRTKCPFLSLVDFNISVRFSPAQYQPYQYVPRMCDRDVSYRVQVVLNRWERWHSETPFALSADKINLYTKDPTALHCTAEIWVPQQLLSSMALYRTWLFVYNATL